MLTFLRKIRRSLIDSGSARKYLLYAIGEITLVVIGILIALQINNWNGERQEKKELRSYLENIRVNLKDDLHSLDEIKTFRDSSVANSLRWRALAKQRYITPRELMVHHSSRYAVFIDKYFQPRSSGFEALKASGYIRKLNGTVLEQKLNNYYYILDKIREGESSLNHTIETMENLAFDKNITQRMIEIVEMYRTNQKLPEDIHVEIKNLVNHPNLIAAHLRNIADSRLAESYRLAEELAHSIMKEIQVLLAE